MVASHSIFSSGFRSFARSLSHLLEGISVGPSLGDREASPPFLSLDLLDLVDLELPGTGEMLDLVDAMEVNEEDIALLVSLALTLGSPNCLFGGPFGLDLFEPLLVLVAPSADGLKRAAKMTKKLNSSLMICDLRVCDLRVSYY